MNEKKSHSWVWRIIRIAIVIMIFLFLYATGQLDPAKLKLAWTKPGLFCVAGLIIFFGVLITVERWRVLLKAQGVHLGFWYAIKLTFIGFYFSTAIPGSVSGDIVKAYYLAKGKEGKTVLVTTILFDRLLGVYTMFMISAVAIAITAFKTEIMGLQGVWSQASVKTLGFFIVALFLLLTSAGVLFMSQRFRNSLLVEFILSRMPFHETVTKVYDAVHKYGRKAKSIIIAIGYSLAAQAGLFFGIYLLCVLLGIDKMSFADYAFILPVSLMLNSIPLAPGGLGVGEMGFQGVFMLFNSDKGAEVAILFHIVYFAYSIGVGGLIYLFTNLSEGKISIDQVVDS